MVKVFDKFLSESKVIFKKAVAAANKTAKNILAFIKANKKISAAAAGGLVLIAAAVVIVTLAVNVWSWTDVTINLPYELYVSCTDVVSGSDNEYITDVVLPANISGVASDTDTVSGSDTVSASDAVVSDSDAVSLKMHIKKEQTIGQILTLAGIVIDEAHSVDRPLDEVISEPSVITVYRLKQVTVQADGMTISVYTDLATVGELLSDQMIVIDEDDRISCAVTDPLSNDMKIVINRVDVVEEIKAESVPYETEQRKNKSMYVGESKKTVTGVNGSKDVTYRMVYVDGILESSEIINEVVTVEPINEVIEIGTKKKPTTTKKTTKPGRYVVSKEKVYDCDGSGHGYYIITYSDGTVEYQDF